MRRHLILLMGLLPLLAFAEAADKSVEGKAADQTTFKVEINLGKKGNAVKRTVQVPAGAKKLFKRYDDLSMQLNPLMISRGLAPTLDGKGEDKDVEWIAAVNPQHNSLVFITANNSKTDRTIELSLTGTDGKPLSPMYRRVLCDPVSGVWRRMAWELPRNPDLRPWTIDIPKNTAQTVTIRIKEPKKK